MPSGRRRPHPVVRVSGARRDRARPRRRSQRVARESPWNGPAFEGPQGRGRRRDRGCAARGERVAHSRTRSADCSTATGCRRRRQARADARGSTRRDVARVRRPRASKAVGPLHKTEVGAVVLDLAGRRRGRGRGGAMAERLISGPVNRSRGSSCRSSSAAGWRCSSGSPPIRCSARSSRGGGRGDRRAHARHRRACRAGHRSRRRRDGALARDVPAARRVSRDAEGTCGRSRDVMLRARASPCADHAEVAEMDCNPVMVARTAPSSSTRAFGCACPQPRRRFASRGGGSGEPMSRHRTEPAHRRYDSVDRTSSLSAPTSPPTSSWSSSSRPRAGACARCSPRA